MSPDPLSPLTRQLVEEGLKPRIAKAPNADLIADLTRIADAFRWTSTRIGQPGCAVRRRAAEDEATVREAIELLRTPQEAAA